MSIHDTIRVEVECAVLTQAHFTPYPWDKPGRNPPAPAADPAPVDTLGTLRHTLHVEQTPPDMAGVIVAWAEGKGVARAAQGLRDWRAFERDAFVEDVTPCP